MSFVLQESLYSTLTGDAALMSLVTGVFDNVDQDYNDFPYITIGENVEGDFSTDTTLGSENALVLHVWDRQNGRKRVLEIMEQIYQVLNRNKISVTGYHTIDLQFVNSQTVIDTDGLTYHGLAEYLIRIMRD